MRLSNLSTKDKERVRSGDIRYLRALLSEELDHLKDDLISQPVDNLEQLRGKAKVIKEVLNLLP